MTCSQKYSLLFVSVFSFVILVQIFIFVPTFVFTSYIPVNIIATPPDFACPLEQRPLRWTQAFELPLSTAAAEIQSPSVLFSLSLCPFDFTFSQQAGQCMAVLTSGKKVS